MSEKGLLSKSIANNISEAIIDKLGGTGYAPTEWSKNINLLGIASADIEEALASITEDASTSEKGGLSLSIASDVGTMLNKKYNTSRGFKMKETASAVSMLSPLPEKTASGAIADFSDGADDVPTKSLIVTIPPTLSGVSSVTETQTGRNILDFTVRSQYGITTTKGADGGAIISGTASGGNVFVIDFVAMDLEAGKYNILVSGMQTGMSASWTKNGAYGGALNEGSNVITLSAKTTIGGYVRVTNGSSYPDPVTVYVQLTIGQDSEPFEKYTPTQYTASLGRTIYGGEVDIVNGTGQDYALWVNMSDIAWTEDTNRQGVFYGSVSGRKTATADEPSDVLGCTCYDVNNVNVTTGIDNYISGARSYGGNIIFFRDSAFSGYTRAQVQEALQGEKVCVVSANPTDFTFTGQEVPTRLGYNAFWSDSGDTEVTYRADLDLYEAPSMLLETNNTETEGNEEQEGNE